MNYCSSRLAVVFAHTIEAKGSVENEDVVGARIVLEVWRQVVLRIPQDLNDIRKLAD